MRGGKVQAREVVQRVKEEKGEYTQNYRCLVLTQNMYRRVQLEKKGTGRSATLIRRFAKGRKGNQ